MHLKLSKFLKKTQAKDFENNLPLVETNGPHLLY